MDEVKCIERLQGFRLKLLSAGNRDSAEVVEKCILIVRNCDNVRRVSDSGKLECPYAGCPEVTPTRPQVRINPLT